MTVIKRIIKKIIKKLENKLKKITVVKVPVLEGSLLKGKVALVTGGSSGIGLSIAEAFLKNGAIVYITGRNENKLKETVTILQEKYPDFIFYQKMDISNILEIESSFNKIIEKLNGRKLEILVNNAGVLGHKKFGEITESDFDSIIHTNLKGTYFLSQLVSKYMRDEKISGNILNVASSSSLRPALSPYSLSKWGLRGFTEGLAKTLIPYGIVVNGIAPGPTATPMLLQDAEDITLQKCPAGRYAMPEEIANLAVVLVSDMGRMIVGDIVYATGGCGLLTKDDLTYRMV